MAIELDRRLFKRLVWLNIICAVLGISATVVEEMIIFPDFEAAFDELLATQFSERPDLPDFSWQDVVVALMACWALASSIGLLWFQRWARFGFWASSLAIYPAMFALYPYEPAYMMPSYEVTIFVSAALFGAIALLSYAKGCGSVWFAVQSDDGGTMDAKG